MQGARLRAVVIGPQGLLGDRASALRAANGRIVPAQQWTPMLACRASYEAPPTPGALTLRRLTFADGRTL